MAQEASLPVEPPAAFADACRVALLLRDRLAAEDLTAVVKTTGGAGLQVLVPLNCAHTYAGNRGFARRHARELAHEHQEIVASATRRERRVGTVLIDWAQNSERRSVVAPYSLRASELPSVAASVRWDELERGDALWFSPSEVLERLERIGDPFEPALSVVQRIS